MMFQYTIKTGFFQYLLTFWWEAICTLAEFAPNPAVKHLFLALARELNVPTADCWFRCMFFNLRLEMEAYLRYEKAFERIVSGCPAEDCKDGMEYNEEWEDDEYDPDEV